jgi:predicted nucleic acid-binding protein
MIIDANVVTYWFVETPLTSAARPLLERDDLKAPEFIRIEIANALLKFVQAGSFPLREVHHSLLRVNEAIQDFADDSRLLENAINIAAEANHKIYDCLYLALALERGEPLATADRRLAALAKQLSIETHLIEPV